MLLILYFSIFNEIISKNNTYEIYNMKFYRNLELVKFGQI